MVFPFPSLLGILSFEIKDTFVTEAVIIFVL